MMVCRKLGLALAMTGLLGFACSSEDATPSKPPVPEQGRISIVNIGDVPVRLQEFTQARGSRQYERRLGYMLYSGYTYRFRNMLDPGNSDVFPGGDRVTVHYVAAVPDPSYPDQPLFENTVNLAVDGTVVIHVKTGGSFSIDPG